MYSRHMATQGGSICHPCIPFGVLKTKTCPRRPDSDDLAHHSDFDVVPDT
jgi:hypothetical protein